jgi:hypothetical protein
MALEGDARTEENAGAEPQPLTAQGPVPGGPWIALAKGARLVARDPRTTRETTFRGPGRVRACVDAEEESWLASGTFESAPGAGEVPGAEEWVITPLAVVRYGAGRLTVDVRPEATSLAVAEGAAFAWTGEDVAGILGSPDSEGWVRLAPSGKARATLVPRAPRAPREAAAAAATTCARLAGVSRTMAAALLGRPEDAGTDAAASAADQVRARRVARAACNVAMLRVHALPAAEAETLLPSLREADTAWRTLPAP